MKAIMGGKGWGLASLLALIPLILPPGLLVCFASCAMPGETPGITQVAPSCHDSMPGGFRENRGFFSSGSHECCLTHAVAPVALSGPGLSNSRLESNCSPDHSALFDENLNTKIAPHSHSSGGPRDGTPCILCTGIVSLRI